MTESNSTAAPSHDAIRLLSDLLALVANPTAAKKVVSDLLAASAKHQAIVDAAKAEQGKLDDLRDEVENGVAELRSSTAKRLAEDQSAFDKRVAEQTNGLAAREKRTSELLAKAETDSAAAAKMRNVGREKLKVLTA